MKRYFFLWFSGFVGIVSLLLLCLVSQRFRIPAAIRAFDRTNSAPAGLHVFQTCATPPSAENSLRGGNCDRGVSIPMTFEENVGQASSQVEFLGRGKGFVVLLTQQGIEIPMREKDIRNQTNTKSSKGQRPAPAGVVRIRATGSNEIGWRGDKKLRAETNYFIGNDSRYWHTHVSHFARVKAREFAPGASVVVYGTDAGMEYDLRLSPRVDAGSVKLKVEGAKELLLSPQGDLLIRGVSQEIRMKKPRIFEELADGERKHIRGDYLLGVDHTIGFRIEPHRQDATLVVDPSLSVAYSSFLGGAGDDSAQGIALDKAGKLYVGGTTTSVATFPEAVTKELASGGASAFFLAKIDPSQAGASSLIYLDFFGGSGNESGGAVAVDGSGNAAIFGTTTSPDYPVTDGSKPTNSLTNNLNDVAVTEVNSTGASLIYSTLFGGSGAEASLNLGGVAFDSGGNIFIASDTNSTNLPATPSAFQMNFGGGISDGFLAKFAPTATLPTPHLTYCTYLGINAQVGIGGVAVDSADNAYLAGFTSNPGTSFPTQNGFQTTYGGDPSDAFLMKFHQYGTGATDLGYGTFLGGSGLDKALAVAVGQSLPATAYVTGTTQSSDFPINGANSAFQTSKKGIATSSNAFFAAITEDTTDKTTLLYSTYLGGSQSDSGLGIWFSAANAVYLAGKTTSWDFPWQDNFQPFNGDEDAFVVKLDPTSTSAASLLYATPLGGTASPSVLAVADGNSVAADSSGHVYIAGRTTAADFPLALPSTALSSGFQQTCTSCQHNPPLADAFLVAIQESLTPASSVSFNAPKINFGSEAVAGQNIPPLFAGVVNTGNAPLNVNAGALAIVGPNSTDFALVSIEACMAAPIRPGATCSFEVEFSPTIVGPEEAFLAFQDDAPGSPQLLEIIGAGSGPLAIVTPQSLNFGNQAQDTTSIVQTITLSNQGNQGLLIPSLPQPSGPDAAQFKILGDNCPNGASATLPPGASCTLGVAFAPAAIGSFQATILFTDDSANLPSAQQSVSLTGNGVAPGPAVNIQPSAIAFGNQPIGVTTAPQSVTLTNSGGVPLTLNGIMIMGGDAASYAIVSVGNNPCPSAGGIVAANAACTVSVNFSPQSIGLKTASLQFSDNVSGSPQTVTLAGTGTASPVISISPSSLDFGTQTVGVVSAPQTVTLKNTGQALLSINSISVVGANPGDFTAGQCAPVLAINANCLLSVTMNPQASGLRAASLSISDNAAGSPEGVPLSGQAVLAGISISPTSLNFASQLAGTSSAPPTPVTVTNPGPGALALNRIAFSGNNATDFKQSNNCLSSVPASSSCVIQVTFAPQPGGTQCGTSQQSRCATMTLMDNAPQGSPNSVSLSGTATDFSIATPLEGTTSATISPGQTATYNLVVSSIGYSGTVSLTCCTGLPAESSYTVTPTTVNLAQNSTVPFQVTITTTAPSNLAPPPRVASLRFGNQTTQSIFLAALLFITLFAFELMREQLGGLRAPKTKMRPRLLAASLIIALLTGACGGTSDPTNPSDPGTPAGSYALILTATAQNTGRTTQLTLIVALASAQQKSN